MPPTESAPRIPEFLDSMLTEFDTSRQRLYRTGLDSLEFQSQAIFRKSFANITEAEADSLLTAVRQPWIYVPASTFVEFLRTAKRDIRTAALRSGPAHIPFCVLEEVRVSNL
jgi:hypothetical protein